jgi:ATP adenylyltransferase
LLDEADFTALSLGMADHTGLGFYNGGAVAGASQPHKHLQWVPLPLAESGPAVPIAPLLPTARRAGEVGIVPGLPFRHAFIALDPALAAQPRAFAEALHASYRAALRAVGIAAVHRDGELWQSAPYNLLITREWLLLVPRRQAGEAGIAINALGFAGSLFVRDQAQLALLRHRGPMAVLRAVALPAPAGVA